MLLQGNIIASADAEGVIKSWDVRKMAELRTLQATHDGKPVNSVAFDASGCVLAATTDTGKVGPAGCVCHACPAADLLHECDSPVLGFRELATRVHISVSCWPGLLLMACRCCATTLTTTS